MTTKQAATGPVDGPWALPDGWRWERLPQAATICDYLRRPINNTERLARNEGKASSELYPYYGATGQAGVIDDYLAHGDYLLLGEDGAPFLDPFKTKAYAVSGRFWVNNHAHVLQAKPDLDGRLLLHWLNTIKYDAFVNGTTRLKLTQGAMAEMPVPIPPLDVQQAIVARIDELFAEVDEGEAALARARADLATWRKALLKAAVTGELTADWRAERPGEGGPARGGGGETGPALLARLLSDRRARWDAEPRNRGKRYAEPAGPDLDGMPCLPDSWAWTTAEVLTSDRNDIVIGPFGSDLKTTDYRDSGVPLVFVRHIRTQDFSGLRPQFIAPDKARQLASHIARSGDVLVTKMGDPPGDAAVYPNDKPDAVVTADCIRWRPSASLPASFLVEWINSHAGRRWIASKTKGVAQQKITLALFRSMPVPIPPPAEVQAIGDELERLRHSVTDLAETEGECSAQVPTLRQSILAAAFRGALG